ncbi:hypothetical protein KIN20_037295 [Parelaphostrongylus tenuis]|uniref:Uncharacterized protein n=1 Tax=Parelaphostrongylus tenuis TaxID=148309 RepID=A0AAD5WL27_PARTN|nr:hypothetical protein KIN20_037295 [Parelaphostrongylus tenuis]
MVRNVSASSSKKGNSRNEVKTEPNKPSASKTNQIAHHKPYGPDKRLNQAESRHVNHKDAVNYAAYATLDDVEPDKLTRKRLEKNPYLTGQTS